MKNERKFVIWYNAQCCGVPRGGCAELENGTTFREWLCGNAFIENEDEFEAEIAKRPKSYCDGDVDYCLVGINDLKFEVGYLEKDMHWKSRLTAANEIRNLAFHDAEITAAIDVDADF